MSATLRNTGIGLTLAMLLAFLMVGSALAKPITVEDFSTEDAEALMEAIDEAVDNGDRPANHGWYVSSFAQMEDQEQFIEDFLDDYDLGGNTEEDLEDLLDADLKKGRWVSLVSHLLKAGR